MKEVKIVSLEELADDNSRFMNNVLEDAKAREGRTTVERRLSELLNEDWIIAGTSGEFLWHGFVILVRDTG